MGRLIASPRYPAREAEQTVSPLRPSLQGGSSSSEKEEKTNGRLVFLPSAFQDCDPSHVRKRKRITFWRSSLKGDDEFSTFRTNSTLVVYKTISLRPFFPLFTLPAFTHKFRKNEEVYAVKELRYGKDWDSNVKQRNVLTQVIELFSESFPPPIEPPAIQIASRMSNGFYKVLYMTSSDGTVIAMALIIELEKMGAFHLDYFCVRPGLRGSGIGSLFFKELISYLARERKYPMLTLEAKKELIPWYLHQGCFNFEVQSDQWNGYVWYMLMIPLCDFSVPTLKSTETSQVPTAKVLRRNSIIRLLKDGVKELKGIVGLI